MLELIEIIIRDRTDGVLADRFEDILNGHRPAAEIAWQNRPAIEEDRRYVETAHGHHHAWQRLVASGQTDERVIAMATHGQFDRVGDHFPADQRRLHALMAHGDPVGHGNRAEFARRAVRRCNPLLHDLGLTHQRDVAGRRFVPARRDSDKWLAHLLVRQAHGVIERAMGRALRTDCHVSARQPRFVDCLGVHTELLPASSL